MRAPALLLLVLGAIPALAQGPVVVVGGGPRPPSVVEKIAELAGGAEGRLVVVPYASAEPEQTGEVQRAQFAAAGVGTVLVVLGSPDDPATLALYEGATGVFFSGGDQNRLATALHGTRALEAIRALHARGGVVAGTSAGAAVMSRVMITGSERVSPDSTSAPFSTVEPGNVATAEGFAFVDGAVVDQHFVVRKRQNRLISLVLERPDLIGLGVDEETAAVVLPGGWVEVVGNRSVQIFDAREASVEARGRGFSVRDLRLHLLLPGDRLRLPIALAGAGADECGFEATPACFGFP